MFVILVLVLVSRILVAFLKRSSHLPNANFKAVANGKYFLSFVFFSVSNSTIYTKLSVLMSNSKLNTPG